MENNIKREYSSPEIECIQLDKEISLQMESVPPTGPDEIKPATFEQIALWIERYL